jgi:hypothetical protein
MSQVHRSACSASDLMTKRQKFGPPPLQASTPRARVVFDGTTVTVTWRLRPVPQSNWPPPPVDYISTYQPTWYGFVTNEPTEAAEAEAWYALIERLQPDGGVTGTPEWAEQASTLLAWGHRVRQGITDQY